MWNSNPDEPNGDLLTSYWDIVNATSPPGFTELRERRLTVSLPSEALSYSVPVKIPSFWKLYVSCFFANWLLVHFCPRDTLTGDRAKPLFSTLFPIPPCMTSHQTVSPVPRTGFPGSIKLPISFSDPPIVYATAQTSWTQT